VLRLIDGRQFRAKYVRTCVRRTDRRNKAGETQRSSRLICPDMIFQIATKHATNERLFVCRDLPVESRSTGMRTTGDYVDLNGNA